VSAVSLLLIRTPEPPRPPRTSTTQIREEIYRMNTIGIIETLWQDVRFGARLGELGVAVNDHDPEKGGGHPEYKVLADAPQVGSTRPAQSKEPISGKPDIGGDAPRTAYQQDLWHYTIGKMVDACAAAGIKPFYGPFGDFSDAAACEAQFRNAFLMGCLGAWSLHPSQIAIAKKVFSPDPAEVAFAKKIVAAMPDGAGAVMIDGKMQDDATWKQAKVLIDLARLVAAKDPEMGARYGL